MTASQVDTPKCIFSLFPSLFGGHHVSNSRNLGRKNLTFYIET